jgi:hypothetical protein
MQWRRVGRIAATVLAGLLLPVAVGAVGLARATSEIYTPRDANAPPVTVEYSARFRLRSGASRHCEHARYRDRALGGQNTAVSEHEPAAFRTSLALGPYPATGPPRRGRCCHSRHDHSDHESPAKERSVRR